MSRTKKSGGTMSTSYRFFFFFFTVSVARESGVEKVIVVTSKIFLKITKHRRATGAGSVIGRWRRNTTTAATAHIITFRFPPVGDDDDDDALE